MENVELELSFLAVECRESAIGATAAAGSRCVCVGGRLGVGVCVVVTGLSTGAFMWFQGSNSMRHTPLLSSFLLGP